MQRVRQDKRRPNRLGEQDILSGLIYCRDCGTKFYVSRCGGWEEERYVYICGHHHKENCTPHTIKAVVLRQIVLAEIRRVTLEANVHRGNFPKRAMEKHRRQLKKDMAAPARELEKVWRRLEELDKLFRKAFEQMALEHLSEQQFHMLTSGYEAEKTALSNRVVELEQAISGAKDRMLNADRFLKIVGKYTYIQELTPELVDEYFNFVGKI